MGFIEGFVEDGTNGFAGSVFGDLTNEAEMRAFAKGELAGIRLDAAAKDFEERGLAGAVRTDDADALAIGNHEREVLKERGDAETFGESLSADDRWQVGWGSSESGKTKDSRRGA